MPAPEELPERQLRAERVRAQLLADDRPAEPVEVVRRVGALQAQDPRAHRLAFRVRTEGLDAAAVDAALARPRTLVTTWLMRGTLHTVTAVDARWLVGLLRPSRSAGRTRRLALGLDDGLLDRALPVVDDLLACGPRTRAELVDGLAARAVVLRPGQAAAHVIGVAAREGVLCRGPERDGEPTYVRFTEWAGPSLALDRAEALTRLAGRYLTGHGPATAADFAAWSGLPLRDARAGLDGLDGVEAVRLGGEPGYRRPGPEPGDDGTPRLLAAYDEHLLGHRGRDPLLPRGGGVIPPVVLADGRVAGAWRQRRHGSRLVVTVEPAAPLDRDRLAEEVDDLGRFLGCAPELVIT